MEHNDIPCKTCILLAICRLKTYTEMILKCERLLGLLYYGSGTTFERLQVSNRTIKFGRYLKQLYKIMKPTQWYTKVGEHGYSPMSNENKGIYHYDDYKK